MERRSQRWWLAGLVLVLGLGWLLARRVERGRAGATERAEARAEAVERAELVAALPPPEAEPASASATPTVPGREPLVTPPAELAGVIEGFVTFGGQRVQLESGEVRVWWNYAHGVPRKGNLATAAAVWPTADGRFRLTGLPLDVPLVLRANSDRGPDFALDLEPFVSGERRVLEVALETSTRIHGYVFDEAGQPVAGRELRLLHQPPAGAEATYSRGTLKSTASDGEGRFEFTRIPHGLWELEAGPEGRVEARAALDTRPGDVGPLHLVLVPVPTSPLEVRLRWPDGSAPKTVWFGVDGADPSRPIEAVDGLVTLFNLTHGSHTLDFNTHDEGRSGSAGAQVTVPYDGTLELELVEGPVLRW